MKALLEMENFKAWRLPSFLDSMPNSMGTIVMEGKLDSDITPWLQKEIFSVISEITTRGILILHGRAGDFGLSCDEIVHSQGLDSIDGAGTNMLFNCYGQSLKQNIHLALTISNQKVIEFVEKIKLNEVFPVFKDPEKLTRFLQELYEMPSSLITLPA